MKLAKKIREAYDYNEVRDYLQKKYGYDERDYAGRYKGEPSYPPKPYLDFWHWVCDHYSVHNGCYITFSREVLEEIDQPWVKEIYTRYLDEFADEKGNMEMYCWW